MSAEPALPLALPRWQRVAVYASVAVLVASGVVWLGAAWPFAGDAAELSPAARTVAAWSLRVHGVAAAATLVVVGSVLPVHLRFGWRRRRNRASGSGLVAVLGALALSGLWLYYGGEGGRLAVSTAHWAVGLVLPAWLLVHRALGLRSRRDAAGAGVTPAASSAPGRSSPGSAARRR